MAFTEVNDPNTICFRVSEHEGDKYHTCSDGCKDIFDHEPVKYVQAWLPVHQIFQGNCGGATLPEVLDWYHINQGADNLDYAGSPEEEQWNRWMEGRSEERRVGKECVSTCRSRWSTSHIKTKKKNIKVSK